MKFEKIDNKDKLYRGVAISFWGDDALINKYHKVETNKFQDCVDDTFNSILDNSESLPMEWYLIRHDNNEIIGYCIASKAYNFLYSFGINKNYRNGEVLSNWFTSVAELLQNHFTSALWAKNTRAIEFLVKNGMEIFKNEDNIVQLKYN